MEGRIQPQMSLVVASTLVVVIVCLFLVCLLLFFRKGLSLTLYSLSRLSWLTSPLLDYHAAFMPTCQTVFMWVLWIGLFLHEKHFTN